MSLTKNQSARDAILKRVRQAVAPGLTDRTAAKVQAQAYLARNVRGAQPMMRGSLIERFIQWSIVMGSTVERIDSVDALPAAAKRYCDSISVASTVNVWPQYADLAWSAAGVSAKSVIPSGDDKTSVTAVTAAIAETGTIVITPSPSFHTAGVLLPENHLAVVAVSQIVATMEDGITLVKSKYEGLVPRSMNFISGPSRTADIEQTLVVGAHGPIRVHIVLVG